VLVVGVLVMAFGGFSLTHIKQIKIEGAEQRGYSWETGIVISLCYWKINTKMED
jgi:hypothetical protein